MAVALWVAACSTPRSDALLRRFPHLDPNSTATWPADSASPDTSSAQSGEVPVLEGLHDVLAAAVRDSALVRHAEAEAHAADAQADAAWAPPDPMVQAAWLPLPVETRTGPNVARIGLSQTLPMPTELHARSEAAGARQRLAEIRWEMAVRDAAVAARRQFAELWYLDRALDTLDQDAELVRLLAARAASADTTAFTWLRAESQRAQLEFDQRTLLDRRAAALAELNGALARPYQAEVRTPAELPDALAPPSAPELWHVALQHRPEWRATAALVEAAQAGVDIAAHTWVPTLQLGAQLMVQTRPSGTAAQMAGDQAGDEALALTVGFTLPVWFSANAARVDAADAQLEAALWARKAEWDGLMGRIVAARQAWADADRLVELYDRLAAEAQSVLPRADAQAHTGTVGALAEARATATSLHLAALRARADRFRAAALLDAVVGAPTGSAAAPVGNPPVESSTAEPMP